MWVHDGEQPLKIKLTMLDSHAEDITALQCRVTEHHKENVSYQKKIKDFLEGADEDGGKGKKKK
jgi:hypothetical protein